MRQILQLALKADHEATAGQLFLFRIPLQFLLSFLWTNHCLLFHTFLIDGKAICVRIIVCNTFIRNRITKHGMQLANFNRGKKALSLRLIQPDALLLFRFLLSSTCCFAHILQFTTSCSNFCLQ